MNLVNINNALIKCIVLVYSIGIGCVFGFDGWKILDDVKSFASDTIGELQDKYEYVNKVSEITCNTIGMECCRQPHFKGLEGLSDFKDLLERKYFAQHIAVETLLRALSAHLMDDNPARPLVMSFHGWSGSGKSFLSELLAEALYKKGLDSKYVVRYTATHHFPDKDDGAEVESYKRKVKQDIMRTLRNCKHALFVFDEVDTTPPGVFDVIVPFIDFRGKLDGLETKKAIYIFLSNTGAVNINNIALNAWNNGSARESLTFKDFEQSISLEAFNVQGNGLYRSRLIDRGFVDYFIPFLPMERKHVIMCALAEARRLNKKINPEKVADGLKYWPDSIKLYANNGCRNVETAVKYEVHDPSGHNEL